MLFDAAIRITLNRLLGLGPRRHPQTTAGKRGGDGKAGINIGAVRFSTRRACAGMPIQLEYDSGGSGGAQTPFGGYSKKSVFPY